MSDSPAARPPTDPSRRSGECENSPAAVADRSGFLFSLADSLLAAGTAGDALRLALGRLASAAGWPVAHALVLPSGGGQLVSSGQTYFLGTALPEPLREALATQVFPAGEGLPGRVLAGGHRLWLCGERGEDACPRARLLPTVGLRGYLAFPVLAGGRVIAVLEFLSGSVIAPDAAWESLLETAGSFLGRVMAWHEERAAGRLSLAELERRFLERTEEVVRLHADLLASERRYRGVLDEVREVVFRAEPSGRWAFLNPAWVALTGFDLVEALGRDMTEHVVAEDREAFRSAWACLEGPSPAACWTGRLRTRSGVPRWVELNAVLEEDGVGLAGRVSGTLVDVTGRVEAELRLEAINRHLAEAMKLKDEFLAAMSHELRTPMNTVLAAAESLLDGTYGPLTPRQDHALRGVEESGRRLLNLINNLLDLSMLEAGKMPIDLSPVTLRPLAESALRAVEPAAAAKSIQLSLELAADVDPVPADARRLKQVLGNLLANAVQYTPAGGRVGLQIQRLAAEASCALTVWDTGNGLGEADKAKLFKPFSQLERGLTRDVGGTGLGLALVARLAHAMGGVVRLESEPGRGSRFTVLLPLEVGPRPSFPTPSPDVPSRPAPGTHTQFLTRPDFSPAAAHPIVLIADDHRLNREPLATYLANKGYLVLQAETGFEAVELARSRRPEIVVMDVQMPGMDGVEALRQLRAVPETRGIPVIVLTAAAMPGDRERFLGLGFDDYLDKPANFREVVARIAAQLDRVRSRPAAGSPPDRAHGRPRSSRPPSAYGI